jgi:hypothetical protein
MLTLSNALSNFASQDAVVTVAADNNTSATVDLGSRVLIGLITPASLTSTAVTFNVSDDNSTFRTFRDTANANFSVVVDGTSRQYFFNERDFKGVRYVQVETGSAEGADRTFKLLSIKEK